MSSAVLVLNRSFLPVHITSTRRAFSLLYQGTAKAVDRQYELFDFVSWSALSVAVHDDSIGLIGRSIRVPKVILLVAFDRFPKRRVRFSRQNIYLRDGNICQYCGKKFARHELNLDHVIPRTVGGRTTWENVVCSCIECNRRKGCRTPVQASMHLKKPPGRPSWSPLYGFPLRNWAHQEWKPFLRMVDASYWNVELED